MLNTRRIALDGVLAAVYVALAYLAFDLIPNELKLTFTSLTLVLAALLFSWYDACLVALVGEFLAQLLDPKYGLSVTTPIWVAIPVLHALALGLCALLLGRKKPLAERTSPRRLGHAEMLPSQRTEDIFTPAQQKNGLLRTTFS